MVRSGLLRVRSVDSVRVGLLLRGRLLWALILCMCWRSSGRDWLLEGLVLWKLRIRFGIFCAWLRIRALLLLSARWRLRELRSWWDP